MDDEGERPARTDEPREDARALPPTRRPRGSDGNPARFWAGLNRHRSQEDAGDRSSA